MREKKFKKSLDAYIDLIAKSWKTVWSHKSLWFIAAIAGIANTGAVFNSVINKFWNVKPAHEINLRSLSESLDAIPWVTTYIKNLLTLNSTRIVVTIIVVVLVLILITIVIVGAQQILLLHSHKQVKTKKHITLDRLLKDVSHLHFFRIFAVDAGVYLLSTILFLLATIPLSLLLTSSIQNNGLVFFALYLILLPLGFLVNAIGMFSLIYIVKRNQGLVDAVVHSWKTLYKHWLTTFEAAMILYVINLIASILFYILIILIAIPLGIFALAVVSTGSIWLLAAVTAFGVLTVATLVILFSGTLTMFNYSLWAHLLDRFNRNPLEPALESIARFFSKK